MKDGASPHPRVPGGTTGSDSSRLGLEEFGCAGIKGAFGEERDAKHCGSGATALGTHVVAPPLGCKVLVSTLLQPTEELWAQQCSNVSLIPKENPETSLDVAMM